jgi:cytochrome oxidase Cu insertion factor (SCO1/SenC/PrrC family)
MRTGSGSIVWTGVLMASFVLAGCQQDEPSGEGGGGGPVSVGVAAPGFALAAAEGGDVSLSDYRGEPVLLYFSMGPG